MKLSFSALSYEEESDNFPHVDYDGYDDYDCTWS